MLKISMRLPFHSRKIIIIGYSSSDEYERIFPHIAVSSYVNTCSSLSQN
jgi:hypothetical protein